MSVQRGAAAGASPRVVLGMTRSVHPGPLGYFFRRLQKRKPYNVAANVLLPGLTLTAQIAEYAHAARANLRPEDCVPAAVLLASGS